MAPDSTGTRRWHVSSAERHAGWIRLQLKDHLSERVLVIMRDAVELQIYHELCTRIEQRRLPVADQKLA